MGQQAAVHFAGVRVVLIDKFTLWAPFHDEPPKVGLSDGARMVERLALGNAVVGFAGVTLHRIVTADNCLSLFFSRFGRGNWGPGALRRCAITVGVRSTATSGQTDRCVTGSGP